MRLGLKGAILQRGLSQREVSRLAILGENRLSAIIHGWIELLEALRLLDRRRLSLEAERDAISTPASITAREAAQVRDELLELASSWHGPSRRSGTCASHHLVTAEGSCHVRPDRAEPMAADRRSYAVRSFFAGRGGKGTRPQRDSTPKESSSPERLPPEEELHSEILALVCRLL